MLEQIDLCIRLGDLFGWAAGDATDLFKRKPWIEDASRCQARLLCRTAAESWPSHGAVVPAELGRVHLRKQAASLQKDERGARSQCHPARLKHDEWAP